MLFLSVGDSVQLASAGLLYKVLEIAVWTDPAPKGQKASRYDSWDVDYGKTLPETHVKVKLEHIGWVPLLKVQTIFDQHTGEHKEPKKEGS